MPLQNLAAGSNLWCAAFGRHYSAHVDATELAAMTGAFQQRHLLARTQDLVDQDYIARSGDTAYRPGQHRRRRPPAMPLRHRWRGACRPQPRVPHEHAGLVGLGPSGHKRGVRSSTIRQNGSLMTFYSLLGQYRTHVDPPAQFDPTPVRPMRVAVLVPMRYAEEMLSSRLVVQALLLALVPLGSAASSSASEPAEPTVPGSSTPQMGQILAGEDNPLAFYDPLSPCSGNCRVTAAFGRYVETTMSDIFFRGVGPWSWDFGDIYFASLSFGRKLVEFDKYISLEPEIGIGKRFGDTDEFEIWGALYVRWNAFFWDDIIDTSIALSTGLNYATATDRLEAERAGGDTTRLQHYFSPEITFSLPEATRASLVVRLHHRSSAGIFDGGGAFQYLMGGLRLHF